MADREREVIELLMAAGEIAKRRGENTNWDAYLRSIEAALLEYGVRPITARTYKLPTP